MLLILAIVILLAVGGGLIGLLFRLIRKPIGWALKLLLHVACGVVLLLAFNWVGAWIGLTLEITLLNAVISGVFGITGVLLLVLYTYLF